VVLGERKRAGAAVVESEGREGPEHVVFAPGPRRVDRRHATHDGVGRGTEEEAGVDVVLADQPAVAGVRDRAVSVDQVDADDALAEHGRGEERVELPAATSGPWPLEVLLAQPVSKQLGDETCVRRRRLLRAAALEMAHEHENRCRRERDSQAGVEREAKDEARRPSPRQKPVELASRGSLEACLHGATPRGRGACGAGGR
jgi:hypothetical protein